MKKTLIALAVLAASGASFAQVTLSGAFVYGYGAMTTGGAGGAASSDTSGLGVDTSELNFTATEDLGGGWKATAVMGLSGADRSMEGRGTGTNTLAAGSNFASGVRGTNASLSIDTPNGKLGMHSTQSADYLSGGLAGQGAYYFGFDGKVFSARTNRDVLAYTSPKLANAWNINVTYQETSIKTSQGLLLGTTGDAAVVGQSLTTYGFDYASGPAKVNANYLLFASKEAVSASRDQTRLSGTYDFGVASVGLGGVVTNVTGTVASATNGKMTDMIASVVFPLGKWSLGLEAVSRKFDDFHAITGGTSGTANGSAVQLSYALSKRTAVLGNYARWTQSSALGVAANQDSSTLYAVAVAHSF